MDHLAQYLRGILALNRPAVDRTGLSGTYDFTLQFSPDMNGLLQRRNVMWRHDTYCSGEINPEG